MGKVRVKKTKKKLKTTRSVAASLLAVIKKSSKGKQSGAGGNGRLLDGDSGGAYGVVPCEYNIQAQIDWLTAPPSSGTEKKSSSHAQPPPSKKPQRGFHRDVCEACGEGECLMYCDKCPSAYHAICDDPPLAPEDFEVIGINWKCKKCRILAQQDVEFQLPVQIPSSKNEHVGPVGKFFQQCLPHQQMQNPVEFKLSKEMPAYDYPFPGTSRHILKKGRSRTGVVDCDRGIVPRPTVLCFHCQRSCRIGALIQCDKCDLFFHLDCLDPPLTTIPATIWMCPLHVEPYLESTQLNTIALSERVKIWDNAAKPVQRSAVILNFMKKAARKNPMFRRKKPITMTLQPEVVPEMVQNCYKDENTYVHEKFGKMQTLAVACEVERLKSQMEENVTKYKNKWIDHYLPLGNSLVEQRARLEAIRLRNQSKAEHIKNVIKAYEEMEGRKAKAKRLAQGDSKAVTQSCSPQKTKLAEALLGVPNGTATTTSGEDIEAKSPLKDTGKDENKKISLPTEIQTAPKTESLQEGSDSTFVVPTNDNAQEDNLDEEEIDKVEQWVREEIKVAEADADKDLQAVNELSRDVRCVGETLLKIPLTDEYVNNLASKRIIEEDSVGTLTVPSFLADALTKNKSKGEEGDNDPVLKTACRREGFATTGSKGFIELESVKSLPKKTVNKLATCHLRNIERKKILKRLVKMQQMQNKKPSSGLSTSKPLITFYVENLCLNVEFTKKCIWIGSGDNCDWKITDFVKCNRIDGKHAKMFYNSYQQCWEILNYSTQGIIVNNTLFGFKHENARVDKSESTYERIHEFHEIYNKSLDDYIKAHQNEIEEIDMNPCYCPPFPTKSLKSVYEGSAKIYPGHKIQIGCAKLTVTNIHRTNV